MTTDLWNGNGDWNLNPSDWSSGVPTSTTPAEIQSGTATISTSGVAKWLTIDSNTSLNLDNSTTLTLTDWLNNAGTWNLGGGDTASIGGRLTNSGAINIGNTGITASTTVTAASLANASAGSIDLQGNASSGTTDQATLDITGTNSAVVAGSVRVLGDADLELASGITSVASTGFLQIDGAQARISLGAGTKSNGVSGLAYNAGTVNFDGNCSLGYGGTTVTTTTGFTNVNTLIVDYYGGDGGTKVTFGGTFTNMGSATIGNTDLGGNGSGGSTTVTASGLVNTRTATLILQGNTANATTHQATLDITGASSADVSGTLRVLGDADLELTTGITSVDTTGFLQIDGAQARISLGAGKTSTGVSGLTYNGGTVNFDGNCSLGYGGTTVATTVNFTNALGATLWVDYYGGDGGTQVTFGGAFDNAGAAVIGNTDLGANGSGGSTTLNATTLASTGSLIVQGNAASGTTNKASLILSGAAATDVTGYLRVSGDALLEFGSGGITTIDAGGELELDGSGAQILTNGGEGAGLSGLDANHGAFLIRGGSDSGVGAGGATVTTTASFANDGTAEIDSYGYGDGGSSVTFGGALTNNATLDVGNANLSASTIVKATTFASNGTFVLQGNTSSGTTDKASLILSGAATATVTGYFRVSGDALLEFGSGGITTIDSGGQLELDGSGAQILTNNGSANGLSGLDANHGTLMLRGGSASGLGAGGATLTTTTAFTNYATAEIDAYGNGDGGSSATFGGALNNDGALDIGNTGLSASTIVKATTFATDGAFVLQGNAASGTTDKASLILSGKAAATVTGSERVSGDATLEFGSGGITSIATGGSLELDGSGAQILTSSGASSGLSGLDANNGTFLLSGDTGAGAGGVSLTTTTAFTNYVTTNIDYYGGDGGSSVTFGGALTNDATLQIGNTSLSAATTVKATTLATDGTFVLQGNTTSGTTDEASLILSGKAASTVTGYERVGGDATLEFGSGGITSIASGGWLEVDGSSAQILTKGGASSGLAGLTANDGTFVLRGDTNLGSGGAAVTTTSTPFTNDGDAYIDSLYGGDGGSSATFGGALTNDATLDVGNTGLSASTTVKATTFANNGTFNLQGNTASGTTDKASLILSGAAASTVTGYQRVGGDAVLEFGSGGITTVGSGGWLELDGSVAQILTNSGAKSALTGLTENEGDLLLRGDNGSLGSGGASLTTTSTPFANYGDLYVDSYGYGDGGSTATFGGILTNDGTFDIGNSGLSAATKVTATGLDNSGTLSLVGTSQLAELVLNGAATTTGNIAIGTGSEIDVTGSNSFTQGGGSTTVTGSLVASTIDANDGTLDFASAIASGDGVGALNIGDLGTLEFGAAVDSTHSVAFTAKDGALALGDAGAFAGSISGFSGSDVIDLLSQPITALAYSGSTTSGVLTVTGSSGTIATLAFTGDYKTSSFTSASDGHGGGDILFT
jgi:hypothetical protein